MKKAARKFGRVRLLRVEPFSRSMFKAVFSEGSIMFFAKRDLDYKLLVSLEEGLSELADMDKDKG